MDRLQCITLARECIEAQPQGYAGDVADFIPHEWVITAMVAAYSRGFVSGSVQAVRSMKKPAEAGSHEAQAGG